MGGTRVCEAERMPEISAGEAATYESDGHVATITYNRPKALNAVNGEMRQAPDPVGAENASQQVRGYVAGTFTGCVLGPLVPVPASDCPRRAAFGQWRQA